MKPKLVIIGTGGHAKVVAEAAQLQGGYDLIGFVDDYREAESKFCDLPVLGKISSLAELNISSPVFIFIAIGDNYHRRRIAESVPEYLEHATIVHPTAIVSQSAKIGRGVFIAANSFVGIDVSLKEGVIVNTGASVDHDCILFEYSSIAPKCVLGGTVSVGELSAICIGATVSNKIEIGYSTVVGAGAVVVKDIPDYVLAYGNPCKVIKNRSTGHPYLK